VQQPSQYIGASERSIPHDGSLPQSSDDQSGPASAAALRTGGEPTQAPESCAWGEGGGQEP